MTIGETLVAYLNFGLFEVFRPFVLAEMQIPLIVKKLMEDRIVVQQYKIYKEISELLRRRLKRPLPRGRGSAAAVRRRSRRQRRRRVLDARRQKRRRRRTDTICDCTRQRSVPIRARSERT